MKFSDRTHQELHDLKAENEKLKEMLLNLFDAHYGTSYHHCGDDDGLTEEEAKEIVTFVKYETGEQGDNSLNG